MKYFLSLIVLFLAAEMIGQPYLNETSLWKQYYRYNVYPPSIRFIEDIEIRLDGDTIIDSQLYFKVLKTGFDTTDYTQGESTDTYGTIYEYMDPIREGDRAIYAYDRIQQEEYLLYDFSAMVGDTLKSGHCKRDTVILIDTLYLGDQPRRQFHLPSPFSSDVSTLIEGIGSTFGLYWDVCNVIPYNPYVMLQCFCQDGSCLKFYGNYDCSSLMVANEEIKIHAFSIHPNPFNNEIEIHFPDAIQQPVSFTVVNSIERITLPDIASGMYIISIRHRQGLSAQKMMKL